MEKILKNIQTFEQHSSELNISDVSESKYSVDIEFDAYDRNGNEVIDDELYTNIILNGKDEEDIQYQIDRLKFGDKIIGYVEINKL